MSFENVSSQAILIKAGVNVNASLAVSGPYMARIADWAQAKVNIDTEFDWTASSSAITGNFRPALESAIASEGAIWFIESDMSGFTNNGEAVTMVNILKDGYSKDISRLKDLNVRKLMGV